MPQSESQPQLVQSGLVNEVQEDYRTFEPLYIQISKWIDEAICTGQYPDNQLPTEMELTRQFKVSRVTVRKALEILLESGLIYQRPRKGTFIRRTNVLHGSPEAGTKTRTDVQTLVWLKFADLSYAGQVDQGIRDAFEKDHPGTKLEIRKLNPTDLSQGQYELAARTADVISMDLSVMGILANQGLLVTLNETDQAQLQTDELWPVALQGGMYGESLVAVPRNLNPTVLCCNQAIFKEAGIKLPQAVKSWDSLVSALAKLPQQRQDRQLWRLGYFHYALMYWENFLWQHGQELFEPGTSICMLDQPAAIAAIQEAVDVLKRVGHEHVRDLSVAPKDFLTAHRGSDLACFVGAPLFNGFLDAAQDPWITLPLPTSHQMASGAASFYAGLSAESKLPRDLGIDLLKCICGKQGQELLGRQQIAMPARRDAADHYVQTNRRQNDRRGFLTVVEHVHMAKSWLYQPVVKSILANEMPRMLTGQIDCTEGCQRIAQALNLMQLDAHSLWPPQLIRSTL